MFEECKNWTKANSGKIGGMDDNGDTIVVKIEETKYLHRKVHFG